MVCAVSAKRHGAAAGTRRRGAGPTGGRKGRMGGRDAVLWEEGHHGTLPRRGEGRHHGAQPERSRPTWRTPMSSPAHHPPAGPDREVKIIAAVPHSLRARVYARLRLANRTFKHWLREQMEAYVATTPLRERGAGDPLARPDDTGTRREAPHAGLALPVHAALPLAWLHASLGAVLPPQEALTIAHLVRISEDVGDAMLVYGTPGAAQLFGYSDPTQLLGRYTSTLYHADDGLVARAYTLARLAQEWCPASVPIRILRAPAMTPVVVVQHVYQRQMGDLLTWITRYTPFDHAHPVRLPITPAMLARAGSAMEAAYLGQMDVARMAHVVRTPRRPMPRSLVEVVHTSPDYIMYDPGTGPVTPSPDPENGLLHRVAEVLDRLAAAQHTRPHYVCLKCHWPWYGAPDTTQRPTKCPRCNDKQWDRPYVTRRR
jgi:hypothetical protein